MRESEVRIRAVKLVSACDFFNFSLDFRSEIGESSKARKASCQRLPAVAPVPTKDSPKWQKPAAEVFRRAC